MGHYLNERYPYQYNDAICCYYTWNDCCIMQGVVNWKKELIIVKEHHFSRTSKAEIATIINFSYPWINRNPYLRDELSGCYYQDFNDESDLVMLDEIGEELLDTGRFIFEPEKTSTKYRPQCLQMMLKALSYALNSTSHSFGTRGKKPDFLDPVEVCYRDYNS
jgi:hypothetical protein